MIIAQSRNKNYVKEAEIKVTFRFSFVSFLLSWKKSSSMTSQIFKKVFYSKNRNNVYCVQKEKNYDVIKTSYQRTHYYENEHKIQPVPTTRDKLKSRPDLYYFDPVVNRKNTIYQTSYCGKRIDDLKNYGRVDFIKKHTLKNLYDDFKNKPVKELKYKETITGLPHYFILFINLLVVHH